MFVILDKKLVDYDVPEKPVLELFNKVSLAKRTASLHLLERQFGEKKKTNTLKKQKCLKKVF